MRGHQRKRWEGGRHLRLSCDICLLLLLQCILLCQFLCGFPPLIFLFAPHQWLLVCLHRPPVVRVLVSCFCRLVITSVRSFSSSRVSSITLFSSPAGVSFCSFLVTASTWSTTSELKENCSLWPLFLNSGGCFLFVHLMAYSVASSWALVKSSWTLTKSSSSFLSVG